MVLSLQDDFTAGMIRAAAATDLLNQRVNSLSKQAVQSRRVNRDMGDGLDDVARRTEKAGSSIDQLSGRLGLLARIGATLGPSLVPIGALAVPAVTGLASQLGFAALAGGTAVVAFQGVGDALKALNTAHLKPTEANLKAARQAMANISPVARDLVTQIRSMYPELKRLRDVAAQGMFPGLIDGMKQIENLFPAVERILGAVSGELGTIASDSAASLTSNRWTDFFRFLADEAPNALHDLAATIGNTAHAMAELWMAFSPVNNNFSAWLVKVTADFDRWASGLSQTDGFAEFLNYLNDTGPQVGQALGAIANAVLQIVEASAPLGGPILAGVEAFAKAVSAIADSDLGTPIFGAVAALSAMNLAMRTTSALSKTTFGGPVLTGIRKQGSSLKALSADWTAYSAVTRTAQGRAQATAVQMKAHAAAAERLGPALKSTAMAVGKTSALLGGLAVASSGAADGIGLTNTASLAMMGFFVGNGLGAAIGGTAGLTLDLAHANDQAADAITRMNAAIRSNDLGALQTSLKQVNAELRDVQHITGFKDVLTTIGKDVGATLHGNFDRKGSLEDAAARGAAARNVLQRERGAGIANAQAAAAAAFAAKGYILVGDAAKSAGQSVKQFTASVNGATAALSRDGSIDAYKTSLLDAAQALKDNGRGLDGNTRKAIANRSAVQGIATGALQAASNMKDFERRTLFLDHSRDQFIEMAKAMGASGARARELADRYGLVNRASKDGAIGVSTLNKEIRRLKGKVVDAKVKGAKESSPEVQKLRAQIARLQGKVVDVNEKGATPSQSRIQKLRKAIADTKSKMVTMNENGAAAARARIAAMRAEIDRLHSKTVDIRVNRYSHNSGIGSAGAVTNARGGLYRYAYGDVANRHMPELAGPGPTRVWREPETQGEAYIPLANDDRRPRARAIAAETVALLGGQVDWARREDYNTARAYARGGFGGSGSSTAVKSSSLVGLVIEGTMTTPFGPQHIRGIVREELADVNDMAGMRARA